MGSLAFSYFQQRRTIQSTMHSKSHNKEPTSELLYTSIIEFKIPRRNCNVRLGPLAYITEDVGCNPDTTITGGRKAMEHEMLDGVYRVHRVKKTIHTANRNQGEANACFTVITLQELDPVKIVDSLEDVTKSDTRAWDKGVFFDNRRWMQFVGTRIPYFKKQNKNSTRDIVVERLALSAYTCQLLYSTDVSEFQNCVVTEQDMMYGDMNTLYIRQLARPLEGDVRVQLSGPDIAEFALTVKRYQTPSIIGIYLDTTAYGGVFGRVMYTKCSPKGNALYRSRAFAIVLGPAFITRTVPCSSGDVTSRLSVPCTTFLYDSKRSEETIDVSALSQSEDDGEVNSRPLPVSQRKESCKRTSGVVKRDDRKRKRSTSPDETRDGIQQDSVVENECTFQQVGEEAYSNPSCDCESMMEEEFDEVEIRSDNEESVTQLPEEVSEFVLFYDKPTDAEDVFSNPNSPQYFTPIFEPTQCPLSPPNSLECLDKMEDLENWLLDDSLPIQN